MHSFYRTFRIIFFLFLVHSLQPSKGQTVLNGDFENHSASSDQINLTNSGYNAIMSNSYSFGSYGDMDIIRSSGYCGLAQSGTWFVAFTGGGTDIISLTLSAPLVAGNVYTISYYDRGCNSWVPQPYQFGLSTTNNTFGTIIHTSSSTPAYGVWTMRTFTFTAPNNGQYLTIQTLGVLANWTHLDNIQFVSSGVPSASRFLSSDSVLCENDCTGFTDASTGSPDSWYWSFPGAYTTTSTVQNPSFICYPAAGTYPVTLHASNSYGGDTLTITNYITVHPAPVTPVITQSSDTLYCSTDPSYVSYQWYADNAAVPNATNAYLKINSSGNYNVEVRNTFGCKIAVGTNIILGIEDLPGAEGTLYPNPASDELIIRVKETGRLCIYNVLGEQVISTGAMPGKNVLRISALSSGMYYLQLSGKNNKTYRFLKQ